MEGGDADGAEEGHVFEGCGREDEVRIGGYGSHFLCMEVAEPADGLVLMPGPAWLLLHLFEGGEGESAVLVHVCSWRINNVYSCGSKD